jgi:hypothetical protein
MAPRAGRWRVAQCRKGRISQTALPPAVHFRPEFVAWAAAGVEFPEPGIPCPSGIGKASEGSGTRVRYGKASIAKDGPWTSALADTSGPKASDLAGDGSLAWKQVPRASRRVAHDSRPKEEKFSAGNRVEERACSGCGCRDGGRRALHSGQSSSATQPDGRRDANFVCWCHVDD